MSLCINPRCPEPDHPGNDGSRFCQSCGSDLVLQNRYRVLRLISDKSGFGRVYDAYERSTPKILKVLKESFNRNDKAVELFQQEALVLSQLHHPGIPMIEPNGYFQFMPRQGGEPVHCIVMEKIDGPNLREWMRQQGYHPISERQALDWLQQIVEVLHLVHQRHYFHRDIKPENIMLRSSGQLVLVDFGAAREMTYSYLAQLTDGPTGITRISSAGYTPPEQELGQAVPQSDFYALGRTFIYLLTGKSPTDASIYDPMYNEFHWRSLAPEISASLADFIDRLTAPRVSDRPRTTQDILDALSHLRQEFVTSRPVTGLPPLPPPVTQVNPETVQQSRLAPSGLRWRVVGVIGTLALVAIAAVTLRYGDRLFSLGSEAADHAPTLLTSLTGHSGNVNALVLSPGEQTLVTASSDNTLKIWDIQTGSVLRTLAGHRSFVNTVMVSPDGATVASGSADKTVKLWDLQTGELLNTLSGHNSFVNSVLFSHNGQLLVSGSADGTINIWNAQTGELLHTLTGHTGSINALVMSRDGQKLISGSADGEIRIWEAATGQFMLAIASQNNPVNAIGVSLDGRSILSGYADASLKQWDMTTGQLLQEFTGHTGAVNVLYMSDDGRTLYSGSADQTIRLWDLTTGVSLGVLQGFDTYVNEMAITSDNQTLITNSRGGTIRIWQLPTRSAP